MITTAQMRGARGILNWSQGDLSERTGFSTTSLGSIENGLTQARESTMEVIQKAFETAGIEFLPNDGIRKKSGEVKFFRGKQGFIDFYDDIYHTAVDQNENSTFYVNNVDETKFLKCGKDIFALHSERMKDLKNKINYKILIQDGDNNFVASKYAEYRWIPKEFFSSVPFYVYGNKLGIILFDNELTVLVLEYPSVTDAYRRQFEAIWQISKEPEAKRKK